MRLAICKIGANITFSRGNASAANADILYALRTLGVNQHDITIFTTKTRNTFIPKALDFQDINDAKFDVFDNFDLVLVFNGSINFFGGKEDKGLINLYYRLNATQTKIVYIQTDGNLWFQQLWPLIKKREWAQSYREDMFWIDPIRVYYLTQGRDRSAIENETKVKEARIIPHSVLTFPWERTILADHEKFFRKEPKPFAKREYDLAFGGATRNTHKRKKIEKYYDDTRLKTLLFGNLRGVSCPNATIKGKVPYQQMIPMMEKAKMTVIIGDKFYNNNFFTLRMYEAILAGNLIFIDRELDSDKLFYGFVFDQRIRDLFYIDSINDLILNLGQANAESVATKIRNLVLGMYSLEEDRSYLLEILETIHESR